MSYHWLAQPDRWHPGDRYEVGTRIPEAGQLIGWRYGAWRVVEVKVYGDADVADDDLEKLRGYKPEFRDKMRAYAMMLRLEVGPDLAREHAKKWHDGTDVAHVGGDVGSAHRWRVLPERYPVCNCCGHLWPCQAHHQDEAAAAAGKSMVELMAKHQPGLCVACGEIITSRQKWLQFPEGSLFIPGLEGPMYHVGKSACYAEAAKYEREKRLPAYPDAARLASCPGFLFAHVASLLEECTAGPMCAGLDAHGPRASSRADGWCFVKNYYAGHDQAYAVPLTNCGGRNENDYPCLGGDIYGGAGATNEIAGDLIRESRRRGTW